MTRGYSDQLNHAFAFAAKHHDQQVRKGTRLPYLTHPANMAVILTRYGQPEPVVTAAILHDVIEDCQKDPYTREMLEHRIRDKFGADVVATVLMVARRPVDDEGQPLSAAEQRDDYIRRLADASDGARWICAADTIHNAGSLLADLKRTRDPADREAIWARFGGGRRATVAYYRGVCERLREVGFDAPVVDELAGFVEELESWESEQRSVQSPVRGDPAADNFASSPAP